MSKRLVDPRRLDVEAFADAAAEVVGEWPLAKLTRLAEMACQDAEVEPLEPIRWAARGERRKAKPGQPQIWLHLSASAVLPLICQRCLQSSTTPVAVQRSFLFVAGEEAAAALDEESEDDVLALTRVVDLRALVEDELLLALPLVPKHQRCALPLVQAPGEALAEAEVAHPFAALASLKGSGPTR